MAFNSEKVVATGFGYALGSLLSGAAVLALKVLWDLPGDVSTPLAVALVALATAVVALARSGPGNPPAAAGGDKTAAPGAGSGHAA